MLDRQIINDVMEFVVCTAGPKPSLAAGGFQPAPAGLQKPVPDILDAHSARLSIVPDRSGQARPNQAARSCRRSRQYLDDLSMTPASSLSLSWHPVS